jgi:integrase
MTPQQAMAHLERTVADRRLAITRWIKEARQQLKALGLTVAAAEVQAVALRLATTAVHLSRQVADIEAGRLPDPLPAFPPPPVGNGSNGAGGRLTFDAALERWVKLRRPAQKSQLDAAARLQELAQHSGHNLLEHLTPAEVSSWRDALLEGGSASTAKRKLAMVRAVLAAAAGDGVPLQSGVLERLAGRGLRDATGTRRERRPFTEAEAGILWWVSRQQTGGRPLDRWAFPLGLALGARLEELAGLRREDVNQVDGVWVVAIQPTAERRLKNDSSTRLLPMPEALIEEGFPGWVLQQGPGLLFPEPPPPATDPRLSHYASVRLGKLLRAQAGISDRSAVFHSSRHFVAQQLVDVGAEQRVIEQILGHSSRSMTARYSRGGVPLTLLAEAMERRRWEWVPGPSG